MPPEPPIRVLVVGATSAIAKETARIYAAYGARLFLAGAERRSPRGGGRRPPGARCRGAVETALLDVTDRQRCEAVIDAAWTAFGGLDVALLAHGVLPDQARCQASADGALRCDRRELRLGGGPADSAGQPFRGGGTRMHRRDRRRWRATAAGRATTCTAPPRAGSTGSSRGCGTGCSCRASRS